jgi:sugar lactone lactonase YvrE
MLLALALTACNADIALLAKDDISAGDDTDVLVPDTVDDTDAFVLPPGVAEDGGPIETYFALSNDLQWPESFAWDPRRGVFLVGSLQFGNVVELTAVATEREFYASGLDAYKTWGVEADVDRRRLYVCASWHGGGAITWHVWALDLDDGSLLFEVPMASATPGAECRDFVVAPDGVVWITDRNHGWLHTLNPDTETITLATDNALLQSGVWSADGVAITPDGAHLIAAISRPPRFVNVDLLDPTNVVSVELDNTDYGMGGGQGLDGAEMFDGQLYVAAVNRMVVLTPTDDTWTAASMESRPAPISGLGALERAGGRLYGLNGDPVNWTLEIRPDLPFEIYQIAPETDLP